MTKNKGIEVGTHWRHQLTQLRCWLDGYKHGRGTENTLASIIPGEDVLRQIIIAIDEAKP